MQDMMLLQTIEGNVRVLYLHACEEMTISIFQAHVQRHVQGLGMPEVPRQTMLSPRLPRRAAKRRRLQDARVDASEDNDTDWEPEQVPRRATRARGRSPVQDVGPVAEAVLRNRITQRHYLQRKKVSSSSWHLLASHWGSHGTNECKLSSCAVRPAASIPTGQPFVI